MPRVVAACVAGAVAVAVPGSSEAQVTRAFAGIPEVAFAYYDVAGSDADAIVRSLDARRTVDPNDGARVVSLSDWHFGWHGVTRIRGADCTVTRVTLDFTALVRLPRLADAVSPDLRARWRRYVAAIERHEAGHVRYAWDHRADIADAIRRSPCDGADAAGRAAIARITAEQVDYDRETQHGATQGAIFP